jgi:hypothetical protein
MTRPIRGNDKGTSVSDYIKAPTTVNKESREKGSAL